MKKIFFLIVTIILGISVYAQQPEDSIFVIIDGDSVHIWNTGALENCASKFRMDVTFSADTILVVEVDTTDMYVPCLCYFDLCSSITGLQSGSYFVKVFRDLPLIFPDTLLYIGSTSFNYGGSVIAFTTVSYQSDCDPITLIKESNTAPNEFELFQNYPNPFNPITKISWQSPAGSHQTIKVFDVLGNEVITLVDEYKPAGKHEVEFDVAQVSRPEISSGIYFYQLLVSALQCRDGKAGSFVETKKMLLLK